MKDDVIELIKFCSIPSVAVGRARSGIKIIMISNSFLFFYLSLTSSFHDVAMSQVVEVSKVE